MIQDSRCKVGAIARLNANGCIVEVGYDWSQDAIRPGVVGKVTSIDGIGHALIRGPNGKEQYFQLEHLEFLDDVVEDQMSDSREQAPDLGENVAQPTGRMLTPKTSNEDAPPRKLSRVGAAATASGFATTKGKDTQRFAGVHPRPVARALVGVSGAQPKAGEQPQGTEQQSQKTIHKRSHEPQV